MNSPIKAVLSAITLVVVAGLGACNNDADVEASSSEAAAAPANTATANIAAASSTAASAAPTEAGQWMSYGRDYSEQRYSPLNQITADNISQLGLAWYGDLAERGGSY